jgi:hypothetical protein
MSDEFDETSSEEDFDGEIVIGKTVPASKLVVSKTLNLPETLWALKEEYLLYGFFDTSCHYKLVDVVQSCFTMAQKYFDRDGVLVKCVDDEEIS